MLEAGKLEVLSKKVAESTEIRTSAPPTGRVAFMFVIENQHRGPELLRLVISREEARFEQVSEGDPSALETILAESPTMYMAESVAELLFTGRLDPQAAFMIGQIRVDGAWEGVSDFAEAFSRFLELCASTRQLGR